MLFNTVITLGYVIDFRQSSPSVLAGLATLYLINDLGFMLLCIITGLILYTRLTGALAVGTTHGETPYWGGGTRKGFKEGGLGAVPHQ
jgi:hypothetical protein